MTTIDKMHPVYLAFEPTNRQQKRLMLREIENALNELTVVEKNFYDQLFDESDNSFDYKELYDFYLTLYQRICDKIEHYRKPKGIVINREYFHDMMFPMEGIV